MITKEELLESIIHECNVCKHLYTKIPAGGLDYQPSPEQRTTLQLLRYLAIAGIAVYRVYIAGSWDAWGEYSARVKEMEGDAFPAMMDRQIAELREAFAGHTEEEFRAKQVTLPNGATASLAVAMLETTLKWLVGYRMQLFLYVKAAGVKNIGTANNWGGYDWTPQAAAEENSTVDAEEETAG